jgi:hypothetical protein
VKSERNRRGSVRLGPRLEALEGRVVLSTFRVANVDQLEAAAAAVSNSSTPNTILLSPGTYTTLRAIHIQNAGNLTIQSASGTANVALHGGVVDRVLDIQGGRVTLTNLTITNGGNVPQGGGIYASNTQLTLQNCTVSENLASSAGAGVYVQGGSLAVNASTISGNRVSSKTNAAGGGIAAVNADVLVRGGAVAGNEVNAVDLQSPGATTGVGGGIWVQGGTLTARGVTFANNLIQSVSLGSGVTALGGAIDASAAGVTVANCTIQNQSVNSFSTQVAHSAGGAIAINGGSLSVSGSTFAKNTPGHRHEFYHPGVTITISTSTFSGRKLNGTYALSDTGYQRLS